MTEIDQFESVFKSAEKMQFALEPVEFRSILLVTDLESDESASFQSLAKSFLAVLGENCQWQLVTVKDESSVDGLLDRIARSSADLICTYRNLGISSVDYPYSLGAYVDVMTQATSVPVVILPHPTATVSDRGITTNTDSVMAITDHLTGEHHLVSCAARFTEPAGTLYLSHVEDDSTFDRHIQTIGRIPEIDTSLARAAIGEQLLKMPRDYIRSCRAVLEKQEVRFQIREIVTFGHQLNDHKRLLDQHKIDLLVMNTKDEDQLAMHGMAYPLSVELRETPLLLL